jgi:putative ABC transport system permease protein
MDVAGWSESLLRNLRYSGRTLAKAPVFTVTVVLTLMLGIGATSAVFSAIDAILLQPLPFPNGDEIMDLTQSNPKDPGSFVASIRLEDWNRMNSTFQAISGYYPEDDSEISGEIPERLKRELLAPRYFQVLGISPALGRDFSPEDERFGGPNAVLISDRFWRRRFGADPNALGKTLKLGGYSFTIIGIMPATFGFPDREVDLWSPSPADAPYAQSRESTWYTVIGRLKPGVTQAQAQADLTQVQANLGRAYPKTDGELGVQVRPLKEVKVGAASKSLWILFGSVSLLLLIACTNIAALLLARAAQRQHEISIRFSIGATRASVVAQLMTEAAVLALAGGGLGLLVAAGASKVFRTLAGDLPRVDEIRLDFRIVLFSVICVVAVTILSGLLPAIRSTRMELAGSLAHGSRAEVSSRHPLQWALVAVQVALAVTLLAGAGLLLRSFQALGRVSPGFDASHVLAFQISMAWGETTNMKALTARTDRILESLSAAPGIESAATSVSLPGVPEKYEPDLTLMEGSFNGDQKISAESRFVSQGYFETMQIPLISGELSHGDPNNMSALVNRSFANSILAGSPVIGRHLRLSSNPYMPPAMICGIVGDAREEGIDHEPVPTVYWLISAAQPGTHFIVRTHGKPMSMAETLRRRIREIEPARSMYDIKPLGAHLDEAFAENRLRAILLSSFAATALSLACLGLYGTLSYIAGLRRREVGLRLALGAVRQQILTQFLMRGLAVSIAGCVAGLALAAALARFLTGMLYGVSPSDPATLSAVIVLMLIVAALASLAPAIRAARLDPMQVLRDQ